MKPKNRRSSQRNRCGSHRPGRRTTFRMMSSTLRVRLSYFKFATSPYFLFYTGKHLILRITFRGDRIWITKTKKKTFHKAPTCLAWRDVRSEEKYGQACSFNRKLNRCRLRRGALVITHHFCVRRSSSVVLQTELSRILEFYFSISHLSNFREFPSGGGRAEVQRFVARGSKL